MTDQLPTPNTPPAAKTSGSGKPDKAARDAEKAEKDAERAAPPLNAQLSFTQHLFIWTLVVVVGVLFGMGGSMAVITQSNHQAIDNVPAPVIAHHQEVLVRLGHALQINEDTNPKTISHEVRVAWAAQAAGLMPKGEALEGLIDDYLDEPASQRDPRTRRSLLAEVQGGPYEVNRDDLRLVVGEEKAEEAFYRRHLLMPAVPLAVSGDIAMSQGDKIEALEVPIDATAFLAPVDAKDPEIQSVYDRLRRDGRFEQPAVATVTIAYADTPALLKRATAAVTTQQAQAYYDAHKSEPRFAQPKQPSPPPAATKGPTPAPAPTKAASTPPANEPPPPPKPFKEVQAMIVAAIAQDQATAEAKKQGDALDAEVESANLNGDKTPDAFIAAAHKLGMLTQTVGIEQPPPPQVMYGHTFPRRPLEVPKLGSLAEDPGLFTPATENGFTSSPIEVNGSPATVCLLRLESRTDAGFKTLDQVRPEVVHALQCERAYSKFIPAATQARDAAQKLGADGLRAYLASPAGAAWKSKPTPQELSVGEVLAPPSSTEDDADNDAGKVALSLAQADHPVMLVWSSPKDDLPQAKLYQATGYKAGKGVDAKDRESYADSYRSGLERYREYLFSNELNHIIGQD